jgi:pyruvate kinase
MLDTVGPELQMINKTENSIPLQEDNFIVLTPDLDKEATSSLLSMNFTELSTHGEDGRCF